MAAHVLYADDDRSLCQIVSKALAGEGYSVRTSHDGTDALAVVHEAVPDLLLIDVMLPRRDGFQVVEALRAKGGELAALPVVLLSGASPTPANVARAEDLGVAELLAKPVPLDKLLEVVRGTLSESKRPQPARAMKNASASRRGASGTFERVSFPALLHHLHGLRATGTLHLASTKKRKWLQMRDGYPVAVRSNLVRETLGRHLQRTKKLANEVLDASRQEAERRGVRQGEVLVAMQALSDEEVAQALRDQADEKFFEIFSWKTGSFRFERGGRLQRANALGLGRSPANLILEGVRTRFPLERIDAYFEAQARRFVAQGESPFYRFQDVHVAPENEPLLREIDGSQLLGDFRRVDERLRRTVYAMLASGLLELRAKPSSPKPRPAKPKAPPRPAAKSHVAEERVAAPKGRDARQDDPRLTELMALADQMRAEDPRSVLGVGPDAGVEQVREAYERLSASAHPDRFQDGSQSLRALAADVFERVRRAYEELSESDPKAKVIEQLANKKLDREERERQRSERAFQAEVECRKGEEALNARSYEVAMAHFGKALELFPDEGDHHAYYGYALHLCHPGDPAMVAEAMEHVKRGLKLASHREKPYLFLGRLHKAVGQADQAEKMFMRAAQFEPDCLEAIRELRLIQMRREKSKGFVRRLFKR